MIRPGAADNINSLVSLGDFWADEFEIADYDQEQWREIVRAYSIYVDHASLLFYNSVNKPVGLLLGSVVRIPHSGRMIGQIHYMYMLPEHAEHDNLYQLHQAFEEWAQGFQVVEIAAPDFYPLPVGYQEFFRELGYQTGGSQQIKGLR